MMTDLSPEHNASPTDLPDALDSAIRHAEVRADLRVSYKRGLVSAGLWHSSQGDEPAVAGITHQIQLQELADV
jgi:hypothetical protein